MLVNVSATMALRRTRTDAGRETQPVGPGEFLQRLFDKDYERLMKRLIEESAESRGYLLIFFGGIDLVSSARRLRVE